MKKEEKELFFALCRFREANGEKIREYVSAGADTPAVLGHLLFNRMGGAAYGVLLKNELLSKVNREFRNTLKGVYVQNLQRNKSYFACVHMLAQALRECRGKYVMLKGAYLCGYYPGGYRTSNDIDILVHPNDLHLVEAALQKAGFRQGYIRNECFVSAQRKDIISSRIMRGETVPFIKEVNLPQMKFLEVDMNFSLDYKNGGDDAVKEIIAGGCERCPAGKRIPTPSADDFFIHLCEHLYKEAAAYPWVEMRRDMTLYKFCDIYTLLWDRDLKENGALTERIRKLGTQKACYYAVYAVKELLGLPEAGEKLLESLQPEDTAFLHEVVTPHDRGRAVYLQKDFKKRFWAADRRTLLREEGK